MLSYDDLAILTVIGPMVAFILGVLVAYHDNHD